MHIILRHSPLPFLSSLLACGVLGGGNCEDAVAQSETSNGTFTYEVKRCGSRRRGRGRGKGPQVPQREIWAPRVGSPSRLETLLDEDSGAPIADPTSIVVSGSFTDTSGESQSFFMIINGVPPPRERAARRRQRGVPRRRRVVHPFDGHNRDHDLRE